MLLIEWDDWWRNIPQLQASELLDMRSVLLVSTPGWEMPSRDSVVAAWIRLAQGESPESDYSDRSEIEENFRNQPADRAALDNGTEYAMRVKADYIRNVLHRAFQKEGTIETVRVSVAP